MSEKVKWIKIDESDKSTWPNNNDMVLLKLRNGRMLDASVNRYQDQFGDNIYFNDWYDILSHCFFSFRFVNTKYTTNNSKVQRYFSKVR